MKFIESVESVCYILPSLTTFLTAWFVHKHTFPKDFTHQQHIFTFFPLHRSESNNEWEVKGKLPQCKSDLYGRKAHKTEEKKCKIRTNKFCKIRRLCKVNIYFLLQVNTKHIGTEKNLLLFGVCTFHVLIKKKFLLVETFSRGLEKLCFEVENTTLLSGKTQTMSRPSLFGGLPLKK